MVKNRTIHSESGEYRYGLIDRRTEALRDRRYRTPRTGDTGHQGQEIQDTKDRRYSQEIPVPGIKNQLSKTGILVNKDRR